MIAFTEERLNTVSTISNRNVRQFIKDVAKVLAKGSYFSEKCWSSNFVQAVIA